jgi:hypothetical protein
MLRPSTTAPAAVASASADVARRWATWRTARVDATVNAPAIAAAAADARR